ncbi:MAG: hypothetical protein Q9163_004188 [Psora crenata]
MLKSTPGDDDLKADLESKASTFDPSMYWAVHDLQPAVIAFKTKPKISASPTAKPLCNMYEDYPSARKLSETVADFISRLPPYSTQSTQYGPWIYIANPAYHHNPMSEDVRGFKQRGAQLLAEFHNIKVDLEASLAGKAKSVINKKLAPLRKQLEEGIFDLSRQTGITSGKWMLFPSPEDVDRIWKLIAQATADGELGHAAKVATDDGSGNRAARLIGVYNADYADREEVKRILQRLDRMGLVRGKGAMGERGLYYKAEAYTWLDIMGGNEWGLKPSLYSSKDVLEETWMAG